VVTTDSRLLPLIRRIETRRNARIRLWSSDNLIQGTEYAEDMIYQPLDTLLGIQTKNVSVYVDFENIAISLTNQGYLLDLDVLLQAFITQAKLYGKLTRVTAYAPWGQRGALPPLLDAAGREIADVPSRLMLTNVEPKFTLQGRNSADIKIAKDVLTDTEHTVAPDVVILASGDRDFSDIINTLLQRNKTVVVWGVRGSTSRMLTIHRGITVDYVDDFAGLTTHQMLLPSDDDQEVDAFLPSQLSSLVIQVTRSQEERAGEGLTMQEIIDLLLDAGVVTSENRGEDLVSQAVNAGVLMHAPEPGAFILNAQHPIVTRTQTIMSVMRRRVANTLGVRGWEYVNYGFLLKGLEMEGELAGPGMNIDDQWRSLWIDSLVREEVLRRDLVPHRHNPEDLVPVISIPPEMVSKLSSDISAGRVAADNDNLITLDTAQLASQEPDTFRMVQCIIVSVDQFTSFRGFAWCPLGSLHRRWRSYESSGSFQRAIEYLVVHGAATVQEYQNPQSDFMTKGVSLDHEHPIISVILAQRDRFIQELLRLFDESIAITIDAIRLALPEDEWDIPLWVAMLVTENVLNPVPGREGQYSLFRTHHTVKLVAGDAL
jgi:hypothetical protein